MGRGGALEIAIWHNYSEFVIQLVCVYTSHLGDSGMKKRPGINNKQGKVPTSVETHTL
jgi:hypothetical protein